MANSSIIGEAKNKIIKEFIKDTDIVAAINSSTVSANKPEGLVNTHIFNYNQNPNTIDTVMTFVTVQVQIPQSHLSTYVKPTVEIWIISHEKHMVVDNVPKVTENRNDYLSRLIDQRLNGRSGFGIGELKLLSNIEGSFQQNYLYRKMVFQGTDLNDSLCNKE